MIKRHGVQAKAELHAMFLMSLQVAPGSDETMKMFGVPPSGGQSR